MSLGYFSIFQINNVIKLQIIKNMTRDKKNIMRNTNNMTNIKKMKKVKKKKMWLIKDRIIGVWKEWLGHEHSNLNIKAL